MDLEKDILKELKKNNRLKTIDIILKIALIGIIIFSIYFVNVKVNLFYEKINQLDIETINQKINELDVNTFNENLNNLKIITDDISSISKRLDLSSKVNSSMDTIDNIVDKGTNIYNDIKDSITNKNEETKNEEEISNEGNEDTNENSNFFNNIKEGISNKIDEFTGKDGN